MAKYAANAGMQSVSIDGEDLTAAFGAGSEFALSIPNQGTPSIAWSTSFSGGQPGSITVLLEVSLDGSNWFTIDTSTSIVGEIRTVSGSYKFVRVNNSAVTVGTGIDLTASFVYSNQISLTQADINLPILQYVEVTVPSAQVLTMFTSPVVLIAGIPNRTIKIEQIFLVKPAHGIAYTTVGVGNLIVTWLGSNATLMSLSIAQMAGFIDVTDVATLFAGPIGGQIGGNTFTVRDGISIDAHFSGANVAAGDGDFVFCITYRVYPVGLL